MPVLKIYGQKKEDVVYLNNGSVLRGIIKTDTSNNKISILNHAGDIWVFTFDEIDSVEREKIFDYKTYIFNKNGFEFKVNTTILARSGDHSIGKDIIPGIDITLGYRLGHFSFNTGLGLQSYDQFQLPIFEELRLRLSGSSVAPFFLLKGGYTFSIEKKEDDWQYSYKNKGGLNLTTGFGMEIISGEKTSLLFSISYHYQRLNYKLTPLNQWVAERKRSEEYNRFCFSIGALFK